MLRILIAAALMTAVPGCYTAKMTFSEFEDAEKGEVHRMRQHTFIGGYFSPGKTDLSGVCPNGIQQVKTQVTGSGLVIRWVTLGIWIPVRITVTCAE
jgi:hypothetical protein